MNLIDADITSFYTRSSEESRLKTGLGPLEFERNKELISRYLPKSKGLIADIGGGPGHYAQWLTGLNHQVVLVAGFTPIDLLAVEGMVWMDQKYFESWSDPVKKQRLLELLKLTEADQELLCLSPHMMLAAEIDYLKD